MRILHLVSYSLFSGPLPGTVGLALAQKARGHLVWMGYDQKRGAFNEYEEAAAPRLRGLGLEPPETLVLSAKSTPYEMWLDRRALTRLARLVDVVHVHLSHDHVLMRLAWPRGVPVRLVRTVHSARSLEPRFGQAWLMRSAAGWIVRSLPHKEQLQARFGVEADQVFVVPGGLDSARFHPATAAERAHARARFDLPTDATVLGHVALMAGRGQEELLRAVALLPRSSRPHLLFIGRGENETAVRRLSESLELTHWVRFAGYLAGDDLHIGYAALDAAFLAQPGNDASARAGLEALSAGLPLLAVENEALAELAVPERGWPIKARTPEAIAEVVEVWRSQPEEAARRGAAGRTFVESQRSFAREAELTHRVYERLPRLGTGAP